MNPLQKPRLESIVVGAGLWVNCKVFSKVGIAEKSMFEVKTETLVEDIRYTFSNWSYSKLQNLFNWKLKAGSEEFWSLSSLKTKLFGSPQSSGLGPVQVEHPLQGIHSPARLL